MFGKVLIALTIVISATTALASYSYHCNPSGGAKIESGSPLRLVVTSDGRAGVIFERSPDSLLAYTLNNKYETIDPRLVYYKQYTLTSLDGTLQSREDEESVSAIYVMDTLLQGGAMNSNDEYFGRLQFMVNGKAANYICVRPIL